jgi:acetoacetyl-CoA synthetase
MKELWAPSIERIEKSTIYDFQKVIEKHTGLSFSTYREFHQWSVENAESFWPHLLKYFNLIFEGDILPACEDLSFNSYSWFPRVKLNFAENLLRFDNDQIAINFIHESGLKKELSYHQLREETGRWQKALGPFLKEGEVLACYMPNIPETVISMLATSAIGGTFTSTSCDFGIEGVVDRFGQSSPKVLVAVSGYQYNGKTISLIDRLVEIEKQIESIEKIIVVDFLGLKPDLGELKKAIILDDFLDDSSKLSFKRVPFNHPQYIMYSSGTTGRPKCIVHSAGGTLLQHVKELGLHTDLTPEKNIFYFTTCGWMMWNWLVSSLSLGATMTLYEGSPGFPSLDEFFEIIDREKINIFGTSPKFLRALEDSGYKNSTGLKSLESILSTGAPLLPEQFDYIYNSLKEDVCVSSISGGTDIIGCFMLGNPTLPVHRGEIQCLGLGMDVSCFNEQGKATDEKEGELVCRKSFPSRPIYFLNDENNKRIKEAYFNHFPGVWHHGDFIGITPSGGVMVFGRSDATLNPGGVRIGTAEIYRQTEQLAWLADGLCVGKQVDGDVEVVLFVKMSEGEQLTDARIKEVKGHIRKNTTPRHVPQHVWAIKDIPYTRSGKKMEMAITRILNKRELTNIEAVANPECLKEYKSFV